MSKDKEKERKITLVHRHIHSASNRKFSPVKFSLANEIKMTTCKSAKVEPELIQVLYYYELLDYTK